jgi:transposase
MQQSTDSVSYQSLDELIARSGKTTEVLRALSGKNDLAGMPRNQIAQVLGCSVSFVSKWRLIYDECGADGLISLHQGGSPRAFLTPAEKQQVFGHLLSQPGASVSQLRQHLQTCYGVVYRSDRSCYVLLHQAGLSRHKSQKTNAKHDPALVEQKRKAIKKNSGP